MQKCDKCGKPRELMTLVEVAEYLQIGQRTAYGWVAEGKLPGFKVGAAWRFDRADMDGLVEKQKRKTDKG